VVTLAVLLPAGCASKRPQEPMADCPDIAATGQLNVLVLNTLYDAPATVRQKSWTDVAEFAAANKVHVLLLQEAVLSDVDHIQQLLGTSDSARDLQRVLNERSSEPYELRVAWETGVPFVLTTANAILSRCDVTRHFATFLPIESEQVFEGVKLKITRNVQVAQLNLPGYGNLHVYNTHLCSDCAIESLRQQVDAVLNFMRQVEGKATGTHILLGGDFNLDRAKGPAERAVYDGITAAGLRDVYAEYRQQQFSEARDTLCWNGKADIHCTEGVSPLQGIITSQTGGNVSTPQRIDYLFLGRAGSVTSSKVVFNPGTAATGPINPSQPAVSDHSGVFAQITLQR
jgi:endonuclease/exonuclease/phosphatase family metal-dependent hydrolase